MSGHVVTVVRDAAGHASSHSYAGVCTRTGQVQGNDEIQQLVSDWTSTKVISR